MTKPQFRADLVTVLRELPRGKPRRPSKYDVLLDRMDPGTSCVVTVAQARQLQVVGRARGYQMMQRRLDGVRVQVGRVK